MLEPIKCFIFDLDGTLVFNERANFLAYQATFKKFGMTLTAKEFSAYFGTSIDDFLKPHATKQNVAYSDQLLQQVKTDKTIEYAKRMRQIEINQPIVALLNALSPHHHTALATTSHEKNARGVLDSFGLTNLFDYMVFGGDVAKKKPDPECYEVVARHFKVRPAECLIFEDSEHGIAAAEGFGAHVCKVIR